MSSKTNFRLILILTVFATALSAGDRPDFSGSWTATSTPTASSERDGSPPGSLGSGWGQEFSIRQDADIVTVERAFFTRGDVQPTLKFRYALDGSETRNKVMMGRGIQEHVSTAVWDGDTLVITTEHAVAHPEGDRDITIEVTRRLSLQQPRRGRTAWPPSLVIETTRGGVAGAPPSTTRTVYTKN